MMHARHHMLPVWFFIGLLLTIYGVIILIASLVDWSEPSSAVLSQYHAGLWGGILLLAIGGVYVLKFWPRRQSEK
jgi:FtsH-binding integral membrane protein